MIGGRRRSAFARDPLRGPWPETGRNDDGPRIRSGRAGEAKLARRFGRPPTRPFRHLVSRRALGRPLPLLLLLLLAIFLGGGFPAHGWAQGVGGDHALGPAFDADLAKLTARPHRLAGTDFGREASAYVMDRLREAGVDAVLPLEMPVWQTAPRIGGEDPSVRLTVRDANGFERGTLALAPCRPNLFVPAVTPPGGLTGPLRYAGRGSAAEVARAVSAAGPGEPPPIVVLEYDVPQEAWERAFAAGAVAVVFRADAATAAGGAMKSVGAPVQLPRFFAPIDPATGLSPTLDGGLGVDLTAGAAEATLEAQVPTVALTGRSVVAVIEPPASAGPAARARRPVVLSAQLDSFGSVPHLGPGARQAANVALLLEAARRLASDPPPRRVVLAFLDNQGRGLQGARTFYAALTDDPVAREATRQAALRDLASATLALRALPSDEDAGVGVRRSADESLRPLLATQAAWARADAARELRLTRLAAARGDANAAAALPGLTDLVARWDLTRRHLHETTDAATVFVPPGAEREGVVLLRSVRETLRARTTAAARRQVEIDQQAAVQAAATGQSQPPAGAAGALSSALRAARPACHVSLELSGEGPSWGLVASSETGRVGGAHSASPEADAAGYHQRVLGHFAAAAAGATGFAADQTDRRRAVAAAFPALDAETLRDPAAGLRMVPGPLVHAGFLAGTHGFFNVAVATCHDARIRDGHPGDTRAALAVEGFAAQGDQALRLIEAALRLPGMPSRAPFADKAIDNRSGTRRPSAAVARGAADATLGVPVGPVVQQRVAGGLAEDRPAPGAVVALFPLPADPAEAWNSLSRNGQPGYEPARLVVADGAGRFDIVGAHADFDRQLATVGAAHDARGALASVSTQERLGGSPAAALRTDLLGLEVGETGGLVPTGQPTVQAGSAIVTLRPDEPVAAGRFTVLLGAAGSRPRPADALVGQVGPFGFYHLSPGLADGGVRVFQPGGALLLPEPATNADATETTAQAAQAAGPVGVTPALRASAESLWALNESRLAALRDRGILRGDLERLHASARAALDGAGGPGGATGADAAEPGRLAFALGQRVYGPLRSAMDDLVNAVVLLLALAVPFAFFGERLLLGAKGIRGRVGGFAACFGLTFAALYLLHPGFAVASTPVIVFLAFAILLLSGLVIALLIAKFRVQLARLHGEGGHSQNAGQVAALLAAVQMGISTMRRRKTRTTLTTLTVVVLTFTVLCFAGFERRLGVSLAPVGSAGPGMPTDSVLVRRADGGPLARAAAELAVAAVGAPGVGAGGLVGGAQVAAESGASPAPVGEALVGWRLDSPGSGGSPGGGAGLPLAREDGLAKGRVRTVIGVDPTLPRRWPAFSLALASPAASGVGPERFTAATLAGELATDGVFLNPAAARDLGLATGDRFRLNGRRVRLAGVIDGGRFERLRHVDGQPVLPVLEPGPDLAAGSSPSPAGGRSASAGAADRLSVAEVAVVGARLAEELGGVADSITVFPSANRGVAEAASALATALPQPAFAAGPAGLERRVLTTLTSVSGAAQVAVPLALGGLIVFGTLLGSISDRRQEIYTFSALGLAPRHIGALFLAEGAVYAVVGGLGGQLLALLLARVSAELALRGLAPELPVNFASGNALFATGVVMVVVLLSSLYPAAAAARSANPGLARRWKLPAPVTTEGGGDRLDLVFPFTVSAADMGGVMGFLAEHFRQHDDAGTGAFACTAVGREASDRGRTGELVADVALAPFDLGVSQRLRLWSEPSDLDGVDRVRVLVDRASGTRGDFARLNKPFFADLRRQFLLWRTLPDERREAFRRGAVAGAAGA